MTGVAPAVQVDEAAWQRAVHAFDTAQQATLVCHVAPDGDALGSMLALAAVLRGRGVAVTCTWGDARWRVPPAYRWLPGIDDVVPPAVVDPSPELLVVLDTGSRERLGVLGPLADAAGELVVIDHHAHSDQPLTAHADEDIHLVDAAAASTTTLVEELLRRMGATLTPEVATCLYVGLVTDTGSFAHSVTTPAVHGVAARLLAAGARPAEITQRLWGTRPFGYLRLLAAALDRVVLDPSVAGGAGLVWTSVSVHDAEAAGVDVEHMESVMDSVRQAAEADVAVVCKGDVDGSWKVSTRSRGRTDVGVACVQLGGGGHRLAAGFTSYDDPATAVRRFCEALQP